VIGAGDAAVVDTLVSMDLAAELATLRGDEHGWTLQDGQRIYRTAGVVDGVDRWREVPGWAIIVAPAGAAAAADWDLSAGTMRRLLAANLTVCRDSARAVAASPGCVSRLILVTWLLTRGEMAVQPLLGSVAGAVGQLGRALAAELGPLGVTVNTLQWAPEQAAESRDALLLLLDPESGYLTGEVLAPTTGSGLP
jgi:NAD(P)-dependent dehydrogenase (short-subunit alcohol dehydrogenase family)